MTFSIRTKAIVGNPPRAPTLLLATYCALSVILFLQGPLIFEDSPTYRDLAPFRSAGYSLIVHLASRIAPNGWPRLLVALQLTMGIGASFFFACRVGRLMRLSGIYLFALGMTIFAPYLIPKYLSFGNIILSEGVAYPLFVIQTVFILEALIGGRTTSLLRASAVLPLLLLVRSQFLFMGPVAFLVTVTVVVLGKVSVTRAVLISMVLLGSTLAWISGERLYHRIVHDTSSATPFSGIQIVTPLLFLSQAGDSALFPSGRERTFFSSVHDRLTKRSLLSSKFRERFPSGSLYSAYFHAYNPIAWETVIPVAVEQTALSESSIYFWRELDRQTLALAKRLMAHRSAGYLSLVAQNLVHGLGGRPLTTLLLVVSGGVVLALWFRRRDPRLLFTAYGFLVLFTNTLLVALVEPTIMRYTIYGDVLLLASVVVLASRGGVQVRNNFRPGD